MTKTVVVPDELYSRLEQEAQASGLPIEEVFEIWVREALRRLEEGDKNNNEAEPTEERGHDQVNSA